MTLYIDMWQDDFMRDSRFIRVRDEKRYVQYVMTAEERHWFEMELDKQQRKEWMRYIFAVLCHKWQQIHGEQIFAIAPTQPGTAWMITDTPPDVEGEVVTEGELPTRGTLPWDDPNRDIMADIREVLRRDERKAIGGW